MHARACVCDCELTLRPAAFAFRQSAAVAYMECVVASRMEGADHWVVLAHVSNGGVMQPDARTAVHHRKVGSYY